MSEEVTIPQDADAERAVLAAVLIDNMVLRKVEAILSADDFYRESHRRIYRTFERLSEEGVSADPVTVKNALAERGELEAAGGLVYIASLLDGVPKSVNAEHHARIVVEKAQRRRIMAAAERLARAASNGVTNEDLSGYLSDVTDAGMGRATIPRAVNLYDPDVTPIPAEFAVSDFIRRKGLHLVWAPPGGLKTWTLLRWVHELLAANPLPYLTGHPDLRIQRSYRKVLWIATEEDAGGLRFRADKVKLGLGKGYEMGGELRHLWAADPRHRITLDDLPSIIDVEGPLDAVVLDSLTGLRPKVVDGQRVKWDLDNEAANEQCLMLRGLAGTRDVALKLVHHTGRDLARGYRGPTDWWASADVMFGLMPDDGGRTKVIPEKNRDGRVLAPFWLRPSWGPDGFYLEYAGGAPKGSLTGKAKDADRYLRSVGSASQAEIEKAVHCSHATAREVSVRCVGAGLWEPTGETRGKSPVYRHKEAAP